METNEKRSSFNSFKPAKRSWKILTSLYIVSGNDQVSHIYGLGKKNLYKLYFDHTDFVCGLTDDSQGYLDELFQDINENTDI